MKTAKILLSTLILSLIGGQLLKIGLKGISFYACDLLAIFFVTWAIIFFSVLKKSFSIPKIFLPFVVFSLIAFISLIRARGWLIGDYWVISSLYLVRFILYLFVGIAVSNFSKLENFGPLIIRTVVISGVLLAIFGFLQLLILPDMSILDPSLGWDPHKNRLASTFMDPNFTGAYLVIALVLSFKRKMGDMGNLRDVGAMGAMRGIILIGILLTFSRSAWGMLVVCGFLLLLLSKLKSSQKLLLTGFMVVIALMAYRFVPSVQTRISGITDPADSAQFRLISWENTLDFVKENPIIGVGFNTYRYAQERKGLFDITNPLGGHSGSGSDSSLLLVFATTGILGGLGYLWGMIGVIKKSITGMTNTELFAITFGLLLESNFINSLFYAPILILWFLLVGVSFVKD